VITSFKINTKKVVLTQYCAGDIIENNEMSGYVALMGERRGVYGVLVGKP
jgi:hypothetical protein